MARAMTAIAGQPDATEPTSPVPGRVSVVVPSYMHSGLVLHTLDSVFAQSHADVEVIVVNDGSPDDTDELLRPLVNAGRIRYVWQENQGQAAARNRGLALASGEFVAFLDDDDLWYADTLARLVAALASRPDAVMAFGGVERFHPDGRRQRRPHRPLPAGRSAHSAFREKNWLASPGQALMRTAAVRAIHGFDASIWGSEDWDLYVRLARTGEVAQVEGAVLHYRLHDGNSSRQAIRHVNNHMRVVWRHIGLDLPVFVRHQRALAPYFVPNLFGYADRARRNRQPLDAVRAHLYILLFQPQMIWRPWFVRSMAESALARPPRG